jgi:hypothetical protein
VDIGGRSQKIRRRRTVRLAADGRRQNLIEELQRLGREAAFSGAAFQGLMPTIVSSITTASFPLVVEM